MHHETRFLPPIAEPGDTCRELSSGNLYQWQDELPDGPPRWVFVDEAAGASTTVEGEIAADPASIPADAPNPAAITPPAGDAGVPSMRDGPQGPEFGPEGASEPRKEPERSEADRELGPDDIERLAAARREHARQVLEQEEAAAKAAASTTSNEGEKQS